MAARFRIWHVHSWRGLEFSALDDPEKVLTLYARTGPQTNRAGIFVFSLGMAAEDLGWDLETLAKRFATVVETLRWRWDPAPRVLFIPDWWEANRPANPNVFKSCLDDLRDLPQTVLLQEFRDNRLNLPESFAKLLANVARNVSANVPPNHPPQEQEQEQEQEQKTPPPTPSDGEANRDASEWAEVEGILIAAGMAAVPKAISGAKARGATPADVAALHAEWAASPGAWDVGALHRRITGDLAVWPPPRADHQRRAAHDDARGEAARNAAANADRRRADEAKLAHEDAELAALEATHGAELDSIAASTGDVERLRALFEKTFAAAWQVEIGRFRNRRAAGSPMAKGMRFDLLRTLAAKPVAPRVAVERVPGHLPKAVGAVNSQEVEIK